MTAPLTYHIPYTKRELHNLSQKIEDDILETLKLPPNKPCQIPAATWIFLENLHEILKNSFDARNKNITANIIQIFISDDLTSITYFDNGTGFNLSAFFDAKTAKLLINQALTRQKTFFANNSLNHQLLSARTTDNTKWWEDAEFLLRKLAETHDEAIDFITNLERKKPIWAKFTNGAEIDFAELIVNDRNFSSQKKNSQTEQLGGSGLGMKYLSNVTKVFGGPLLIGTGAKYKGPKPVFNNTKYSPSISITIQTSNKPVHRDEVKNAQHDILIERGRLNNKITASPRTNEEDIRNILGDIGNKIKFFRSQSQSNIPIPQIDDNNLTSRKRSSSLPPQPSPSLGFGQDWE